jgi:hypothetical protein
MTKRKPGHVNGGNMRGGPAEKRDSLRLCSCLRKNRDALDCFSLSASKMADIVCAHNSILAKMGETDFASDCTVDICVKDSRMLY